MTHDVIGGPVGVWSSGLRMHPDGEAVAEAVAELEELGYAALFAPGGTGGADLMPAVRRLLDASQKVTVATGVLNIWMHEPAEVATAFAAIDEVHPGRLLLGLGISHAPLVDREEPGRYQRPLATMRAYLDALDDGAGAPVPAGRRALGALGPRMLDLAAERTSGAHPYLVPVEHTRFARDRLGPGPLLAVEQAVLLEADPRAARERAREHVAVYLGLPNYVNNLLRHGFDEEDLRDGGSDRLVDAVVAWGDEESVAARVAAHREAGADHVCVQVIGENRTALPRAAWRALAGVLT